jgi:hypothetical protein
MVRVWIFYVRVNTWELPHVVRESTLSQTRGGYQPKAEQIITLNFI